MANDFIKKLDDLLRQELSLLGHDYGEVVVEIQEARSGEGAVIRAHPPWEDIPVEEPEPGTPDEIFAARLRRALKTILEAPGRPPAPPDSV